MRMIIEQHKLRVKIMQPAKLSNEEKIFNEKNKRTIIKSYFTEDEWNRILVKKENNESLTYNEWIKVTMLETDLMMLKFEDEMENNPSESLNKILNM